MTGRLRRIARWFVYRSAVTGRFVTRRHADNNPNTTIREQR